MRTPQRETDFTSERHALAIAFFLVLQRERDRVRRINSYSVQGG